MPDADPGSAASPRSENCSQQAATAKTAKSKRTHESGTAFTSDACVDLEADEDDDFAADIAGASDAECEESVLEDLEPIEPEEVLDLVDAQSASESADASEESDAEPEASSSQPRRSVVNKAAPLICDTQFALAKQPSILYPQRPVEWRAPKLIAQLNAAAVRAASSTLQPSSVTAGVYRFPPPVFAKPPPVPVEAPPASKSRASTPLASQEKEPSVVDDDIPPPCEPEGDDCCDWAAFASTLCPTSPTPSTLQHASKTVHAPSSGLTVRVETTKLSNSAYVNSARLLPRPAASCGGRVHSMSTPQCAPATTRGAAVSMHAPCVPAPASRTITPGVVEQAPQGVHRLAESQPNISSTSGLVHTTAGDASQPVSLVHQQAMHGSIRHTASIMPPRSHIVSPHFSPFSTPRIDSQCHLMDDCPSPGAIHPSICHPPSTHDGMCQHQKAHQAHSHTGHHTVMPSVPQTDAQPPAALDLVGGEVADAPDPLSDILGEIDQFILHQSDISLLPNDHAAIRDLPLSNKLQPDATRLQSHTAKPGTVSSVPTNSTAALSDSARVPSLNHAPTEEFVPQDADFQPLTPRTPRSCCDEAQGADALLTDWEAVFPGVSPVAPDVAWGSDCGNSPQLLSPEMSLLSPILQRMQNPAEYNAITRQEAAATCSPDVCKLSIGAGQDRYLDAAIGDPAPRVTTTAGCAVQESEHLVNGCDRQGVAACHYEPCSTGSHGGRLQSGGVQPGPPVKRRLDLSCAYPVGDSKQQQSCLRVENAQTLAPFDAALFTCDADTGDENMNHGNYSAPGLDLAEHQLAAPAERNTAADALQALLAEVDAVVACGPTGFSSPGRSPMPTTAHQSSIHCQTVQNPSGRGDPNAHAQSNDCAANDGLGAPQETEQPHSVGPEDSIQRGTEGKDRAHSSGCLDRAGVGDEALQDTLDPGLVGGRMDADPNSADAEGLAKDPACVEDIADDDLYRLFAATCTGSLTEFQHPSLPTFTDLLLNDDADMDWFETEAPDMDFMDLEYQESKHPDSIHDGDLAVPQADQLAEPKSLNASESKHPGVECARRGDEVLNQGAEDTVSGQKMPGQGQKRTRVQAAEPDDDSFNVDTDGEEDTAPKMSRFERYEKRCQLREKVPEPFDEGEPPRPFTRSCREQHTLALEDSKQADTEATHMLSDMAGDSAAAAGATEWTSVAASSTTDVHMAACAEPGAPNDPELSDVPVSEAEVKERVFSPTQLRQLYAQIQAHVQLLVQTLALTAPGAVSPNLSLDKLWGWRPDAPSPTQQADLDEAAGECWRMLTEWQELSIDMESQNPARSISPSQVGALAIPSHLAAINPETAAENLCDSLQQGWRPVLVHGSAPCIAHVPWLDHVSDLVAAFGVTRPYPSSTAAIGAVSPPGTSKDHSAAENVAPDPQATTSTCTAVNLQLPQSAKSPVIPVPTTRGSKKSGTVQSSFLVPVRNDPDETRQCTNAKRLSRSSPFAPHVHAAFAKFAVHFNRALFPRIVQASLVCNDKRRKQISLCEQRLMAVCVMQYGRNYDRIADLMPGWTTENIRARLHNFKRLIKTEGKENGVQDMRVALAEIVHRVIDIAKGPLNKEEFDLVSQNMQGTCSSIVIASDGVKDKFEHISRNFVTWRTPKLLSVQWHATATAPLPVLKGTPRPVQELRQLLSPSRLNGAHPSLYLDDETSNLAPGSSCSIAALQYNTSSAADGEHAAAPRVEESERAASGGSGKKKGEKKRKAGGQAAQVPSRVSAIEEWPAGYKADVLKHAQQLCEASAFQVKQLV